MPTTITGTAGNDTLTNSGTGVTINALGGNDSITDSGSGSIIDGGAGNDMLTLDRSASTSAFTLSFTAGSSTVANATGGTKIKNIEILQLTTGSRNDAVTFINPTADAIWGNSYWDGGAGTDTATVNLSAVTNAINFGRAGLGFAYLSDTVQLRDLVDFQNVENFNITSGSGDDYFRDGSGKDTFNGGAGSDRISFYNLNATHGVVADLRTQTISNDGFGNTETMSSIEGLGAGTVFADTFDGNNADNDILGSTGDTIHGWGGNDIFQLDGAPALLDGGTGTNSITFFTQSKLVSTSGGVQEIFTNNGVSVNLATHQIIDDGFGGSGTVLNMQNLNGSYGDDILIGDAGNNEIGGNGGNDTIDGGAGNDAAVFYGLQGYYTITRMPNAVRVVGDSVNALLTNIESLKFVPDTGTPTTIAVSSLPVRNSALTLGVGYDALLSTFMQFEGAQVPENFLGSDASKGAAFRSFLTSTNSAMTVAKNTATQGILHVGTYYLVISGSGLSLSKGSSTGELGDYLMHSSGAVSTMRAYQGGSVDGGTYSGGTLIGTMTVNATSYTLTVGTHEVILDGTGLPTSLSSLASIKNLNYSGSLSFSDMKYLTGGTVVKTFTIPNDPLLTALNDYQAVASVYQEFENNGSSTVSVKRLSGAQVICQYASDFIVFNGSSLGYSGSMSKFDPKLLTGTVTNIKYYKGGTYNSTTHALSGGTLKMTATMSATQMTLTVGNIEFVVDGTHLPTSFATLMQVIKGTYSGSAIGLSDIKIMKGGVQAAAITLTSSELDITLLGYKLAFKGTFSTSILASFFTGTEPTLKVTGVTATKISSGATVLSVSGLSSAVSLLDADGKFTLDALFNTLTSVNGSVTSGGISVDLNSSMFTNVTTVTGGSGNDTITAVSGNDTFNGGAGNDTFNLGAYLTAADKIDGGTGTDTLNLDGNYSAGVTFNSTTLKNVEKIVLAAGHSYKLTTNDATIAAGQTLTINDSALSTSNTLTFNGAAETDGHFIIISGKGADQLTGGALSDTFVYSSATQSTSTHYDTITGLNFSSDKFDIPGAAGTITGINTKVASGALSTSTFDANLTTAMSGGHLSAHHAVLFTPNSGTLSGQTFLIVDLNGVAGYQSGQDLVVRLTGQTGTLAMGGFG